MFSLMSFFLVVNLAVMMRELTGFQPMSAARASGANIRATPSVWGAPSWMCPEYSSCSPDESLSCLDCSHLVSLSPSTPILYLFIILATWTVFPVSYIVLMFHVASSVNVLGVRRGVSLAATFRLSLHCIISLLDGDPSLPRCVLSFLVVEAFLWVGSLALRQPLYPPGELFLP